MTFPDLPPGDEYPAMKRIFYLATGLALLAGCSKGIDREALVRRNCPHLTAVDTLASLSVGNGGFAFTADVTGLQTWPELYSKGVPLGTMSDWGWHSFPNTEGYTEEECLRSYDFGRGRPEPYSCQFPAGRQKAAADYMRANLHRLHLGAVGFGGIALEDVSAIDQTLDMWEGVLRSSFKYKGVPVKVQTSVDPSEDVVCAQIETSARIPVQIRFPYPTGMHTDDACDWSAGRPHRTVLIGRDGDETVFRREIDDDIYYVTVRSADADVSLTGDNTVGIVPQADSWSFSVLFSAEEGGGAPEARASQAASAAWWRVWWRSGAAVDFSRCTDPRAAELERRVVLSQYLTAVQSSGDTPPQETGLTYNSWFGKFHLEMEWWHQAHFALWGRPEMLERTLPWYFEAEPVAREIASRQGFEGVRWMKMTDPSGKEAPSNIGSFLIWQQPHLIYLAELLRRAGRDVSEYSELVGKTAGFMLDFASYDEENDRYVLKGCIPAQETLKPETTVNPPFELSYWHYALGVAREWQRAATGGSDARLDGVLERLSPLAARDGLYLAAESEPDTYSRLELYSDHMAVLAAYGVLPESPQFDKETMRSTLHWVMDNWNWDRTWGWDFPVTCMTAVRLGEPETALDAILMDQRTNTYLPNGHNYQNSSLRCYLPGNGGLLTAVALMCAGYDGCPEPNPGFPKDGSWDVRWEGLLPLP